MPRSSAAAGIAGIAGKPKAANKARTQGAFGGRALETQSVQRPSVIGGVRYSILRRSGDGSFADVDPSTVFAPGDALRLRFETNQPGNLAVMEQQPDAKWTLRLAAGTQPGQPVYMPSESTINLKTAGTMRLFVRFSRSLRNDARLDQVADTPNLLRESATNSVYVVNPIASTDPLVDFEIAINAR
jgi:hypothetical protein